MEEDDRIKRQIEDAERLIEKELAESSSSNVAETGPAEVLHSPKLSPDSAEPPKTAEEMDVAMEEEENEKPQRVGEATNEQGTVSDPEATNDVPMEDDEVKGEEKKVEERNHHDDHGGEELVEGQEDDVIY